MHASDMIKAVFNKINIDAKRKTPNDRRALQCCYPF
jgi:hypothetical protein